MDTNEGRLTIQQVAEQTGLSVHTLRYYERIGLIHSIARAGNSHRRYSAEDIDWINFLMKLRATGMTIQQMQAYASLQRQGDATVPQRLEMLEEHRCLVEEQVAALQEHLKLIYHKIEVYGAVVAEQMQETSS